MINISFLYLQLFLVPAGEKASSQSVTAWVNTLRDVGWLSQDKNVIVVMLGIVSLTIKIKAVWSAEHACQTEKAKLVDTTRKMIRLISAYF